MSLPPPPPKDPTAPFGVDLLLPKVGGGARKTNYDYTHGTLDELIDITIQEGAKVFITAVGVPPQWVVDKLHAAGILCMNMVWYTCIPCIHKKGKAR